MGSGDGWGGGSGRGKMETILLEQQLKNKNEKYVFYFKEEKLNGLLANPISASALN